MEAITELELLKFIEEHLDKTFFKSSKLEIKNNKGNYKSIVIISESTAWRFNDTKEKLFFRFSINNKDNYIAFPNTIKTLFNKYNLSYYTVKSDAYLRVNINDFINFSDNAISEIINQLFIRVFNYPSFGCCGKHKECTEKGYCVHDDIIYSTVACQYKRIIDKK